MRGRGVQQGGVGGGLGDLVHRGEVVAGSTGGLLRRIDHPTHHGRGATDGGDQLDEQDHVADTEVPVQGTDEQYQVDGQEDEVHAAGADGVHKVPPA